jgi:hypothetical protein
VRPERPVRRTRGGWPLLALFAATALPALAAEDCDGPDTRTTIPWEDAVNLIRDGSVTAVYQSACRDVRLDTDDGEIYYTVEPAQDEVLRVIDESAPNRAEIRRAPG